MVVHCDFCDQPRFALVTCPACRRRLCEICVLSHHCHPLSKATPPPAEGAAVPRRIVARTAVERFEFRGFFGRPAWCELEIIPLADGRTVVIATELADNPGTSVTNVAEHLASHVCDAFGIDPDRLVWVEHYGYPSAVNRREPRSFDRVTFARRQPDGVRWSEAVLRHKPDGWPGYFEEPEWREMGEADWQGLGLTPRQPRTYP